MSEEKNDPVKKMLIKEGILYYDHKRVGESEERAGFLQYNFDEEPLGYGANGITFSVTHKILNVKQVIKIYFPHENESYDSRKAREEAKKNANPSLAGVIAVIFDAGVYHYPCKLFYSIMECVPSYSTIKQWRKIRDKYFPSNNFKFDIDDVRCKCSIFVSMNLAAGLLKSIITLYENKTIHGDLNPGNVLWILEKETLDDELEKYALSGYSMLGNLSPFCIRLIDLGTSKLDDNGTKIGMLRDSIKVYEHMKSFLSPLFAKSKLHFIDWFHFAVTDIDKSIEIGVKQAITISQNGKTFYIFPQQLAGDFFRLISVLTIAFGIIANHPSKKESSIQLSNQDKRDFCLLMYEERIDDVIDAFSLESIMILKKLYKMSSKGSLISWENVWNTSPLNRIDISPVFAIKK